MTSKWEEAFDPFFVQRVVVCLVSMLVVYLAAKPLGFAIRCLGYVMLAAWCALSLACVVYTGVHTGVLLRLARDAAGHFLLTDNAYVKQWLGYL